MSFEGFYQETGETSLGSSRRGPLNPDSTRELQAEQVETVVSVASSIRPLLPLLVEPFLMQASKCIVYYCALVSSSLRAFLVQL